MITSQCIGFLNTPPLWEKKQFDIQQFEFPSLKMQSFQPQALPNNLRIGHQMEYVFKQLVAHSKTYDVVLHNLPIRQDKRTLGEIDFILKDKRHDKLIHVELTYKYYIIDHKIEDPIHSLIGPNKRDSFYLKMEKIKNVQFPLLHSDEGATALNDIDVNHLNIEHQCCFKAQLFRHYESSSVDIGALNIECLVGYWLRLDEFNQPTFTNAQYYIPLKAEWVMEPHVDVAWRTHAAILKDIKCHLLQERAPMVWLKKDTTQFEKLFLVWW